MRRQALHPRDAHPEVKDVLDMLAGGASQEEILVDFPDLEAEDIRAYVARYLDHAILVAA